MIRLIIPLVVAAASYPALAQQPSTTNAPKKPALDPNERICETLYVGTRVNTQRFCGTRAEWEAVRRQEREGVDQLQRPMQCAVMTKHC